MQKQTSPAKSPEVSPEKAVIDAIAKIWFVGSWLVVIYSKWSWQGLILFLTGSLGGVILAICLLVFGAVPQWIVPEKYTKQAPESGAIQLSGKLEIMDFPEDKWPNWFHYYKDDFDKRSDDLLNKDHKAPVIKILTLKNPLSNSTKDFIWQIEMLSKHLVERARAFRLTRDGLMQPLNKRDNKETHLYVPSCRSGDTLVVIVLLTKQDPSVDYLPQFDSIAYAP